MRGPAPRWPADLALAFVALIWGATFVLVKQALADISTLLFLTLRFSIASLALALILGPRAVRGGGIRQGLKGGVLAGAFLFGGYVLQTLGLKLTTPSKAGFLTGLYIPLVPLLSAVIYRRLPRPVEAAGVALSALGMGLMTVEKDFLHVSRGDLLVIGCAAAYALHILVLGHFTAKGGVAALSLTQIVTGALLGASTFWWAETPSVAWTGAVWAALAITSLLATALAFSIQTWAQQRTSPTRTALIFALEPVFAWLTSFLVTGEVLPARAAAGAVLILGGILMVELKPSQPVGHPSA